LKKIISLLLALAVMFSLSLTGTAAFAAEIKYSDIVIGDGELSETGENAASDNAKVIQAAFDEAKNKASDKNRYRIYFPKGEYHINTTLNIFSNTELYLDEKTTLVQDAPKGQNIVKAGDFSQKHILYNGFRNIKIDGGKWDMQFNGSCAMRFGHCTNLSISNVNITNILDAHHIEAAAVDTLSITDSTFTSSLRRGSNSCEAIQLDILHDSKHFPGFEEFDDSFDKANVSEKELLAVSSKAFCVINDEIEDKMRASVEKARLDGDSVGGVIECAVVGVPVGIGANIFSTVEGHISSALFGVPAVKGVEFGAGFDFAKMTGYEANDTYSISNGNVKINKNNNGGVLGGMTTGAPIIVRAVIKPTPSISKAQKSVNLQKMTEEELVIHGRHDPCIVPRAVPVVESAVAFALLDLMA
jgi:hypothetical protein